MADSRTTDNLGQRVKALRKARGYRTTRDLAEAATNTGLTESVIENIEAGRKADLPVSQLLNLAYALGVPPVVLLADVTQSEPHPDYPNLSPELQKMSASEFDSWLAGAAEGQYRPRSALEHSYLNQLEARRELVRARAEILRISAVLSIEKDMRSENAPAPARTDIMRTRLDELSARALQLEEYLQSAGWTVSPE